MDPVPPTSLGKETIRVWHGWNNIGDKEVAREAAAKGLHIDLAVTFLSLRRKIKFEDAKIWFKDEVIKWACELLERKQIFKASHVLNNIGVDSAEEFSKIFSATTNKSLREYIGNHLIKVERLEGNLNQLWCFLNLILENAVFTSKFKLPQESLECLDNQNEAFKSEVATVLFLKTEDIRLSSFLNAEVLWKHLLMNNDLNHLLRWINIRYNKSTVIEDSFEGNFIELFKKFPISSDMLNLISNEDLKIAADVKNAIYNELSRFGIFQNEEKNNFFLILERLKNSFSISNLYQILSKSQSVISIEDFINLLIDYCLEQKQLSILNICVQSFNIPETKATNDLKLIKEFNVLVNYFTETVLSQNIFNMSNMLHSDITNYFKDNPVIFLSLLFFTNEINMKDTIVTTQRLIINDVILNDCVLSMLKNFKILKEFCDHNLNGTPKYCLNIYNLIDEHFDLDSQFLFKFRFTNNDLFNLYNLDIVENYGYSKRLGYKFYLKESRPGIAAKIYISNKLNINDVISKDDSEKKMFKIAVTDIDCDEICASCVSCMELTGLDSSKLRVLIRTAKILCQSGCEKELLINSEDESYTVQNLLEKVFLETIESNSLLTGSKLLEAFQMYEIIIQYSKINNIKLPELFLKYCASHNFWLPFLLMAQIYEYPVDQIKLLTQFFKSPNMLEHLTHGVLNDIQMEEKNILIRERDSRKYLLSKVGVRKSIDTLNQYTSQSIKSQSSFESEGSSTSSDLFEIDICNIKATLLQTLIRCHNSTDPPKALLQASQLYRNPLLAIFSTSYEPDSIITNWLTWLSVSCELCKVFTNYETTAMIANSVTTLLGRCMENCYPRTILESFEIFLPDNPLKIFMEFLNSCYKLNLNNTTLVLKLETFEAMLKNCRKNSIISETDHEITYLNNRIWIEKTAVKLLSTLLEHCCNSLYEQILIIRSLCKIKFWKYFTHKCLSFNNLLSILEAFYYSNSGVRLNISLMFHTQTRLQAIISCVNELLEKQYYKVALNIAQIANLMPDLILVKEWQNKMSERNDQNFWYICNEDFTKNNVTADCVVDFYWSCYEKSSDVLEKFILLKLAWEWSAKYDLTCQYELEKKMWVAFLYLDEKHKNLDVFDIQGSTYLYKDLTQTLKCITPYENELNKDFVNQLECIIDFVLNKRNFWLALKLQKMFNCKNTDLETLKLCHSLAEGILLPYQLNAEQRLLLSNVNYLRTYSHRRTFLSTRFSSFSSSSHSPANSLQMQTMDGVESYMNDTLAILKLLSEHLHNGVDIAQNVFMNYRISINIEIPYEVIVVTTDYMKILKDALEDNCMNKLDVVHDFILSFKWSKDEVADFVCEELVNATIAYVEANVDHIVMWDLNIDQDFQLILHLLQDNCSLLGYKIYSYASTLHKAHIESDYIIKTSDLALVIELMIKAHECFTADCNMEGISIILKKSKEVVSNVLVLQDWKLIVRLLTGVARYTEMNYVFQILKENDQFEFLLRKGLKKDNTLKVALLEYLKKYCPDNGDLYKIVALHFALFSEVALLWETEAQNVIRNLISISILEMQNNKLKPEEEAFILLQNTDSTRKCLNKAMENYIHATDFHLQGEKLTNATNSAKQAELIALQLSFLNEVSLNGSVVCLLNLKTHQIAHLISTKLSFKQSMIVVEAYNFQADWASVLYEQYFVKNNEIFLEGFIKHLPLTETLVHDISRKFITSSINSVNEIKCMKNVLERLPSLHIKYRIASELGFTDLVEELITSGQLVYLKDTVWKKGYKN